jgi:hypothetical protein
MDKKQLILAAAALAGLSITGCAATKTANMKAETVMCHGVNACKGHGQCGGKVDGCSGKNGCEMTMSCSGKNSCKGKGLVKMNKKKCLEKGGKAAS